jgi:thiamine transport system ATP-binding protein
MLVLKEVEFNYSTQNFNFSLAVKRGEALGVIGASGAGKTTLFNLISGFILPMKGQILLDNQDITYFSAAQRPITNIFQQYNLFEQLNIFNNILIGLKPNLKATDEDREKISTILKQVGLPGMENRMPHQLSGGQAQRIALARALVRNNQILLLDEPFAALDPGYKTEMIKLLKKLLIENDMIMLIISHNPQDCLSLCARTAFIDQGKIYQIGETNTLINNKNDPKLRIYLGDDL